MPTRPSTFTERYRQPELAKRKAKYRKTTDARRRHDPVWLFYKSPEWKRARAEHLRREPSCRECGSRKRRQVDHIKPIRTHWDLRLEPTNLRTLCDSHHARRTRRQAGE